MKAAVLRGAGEGPVYADFDEPQVTEGRELVELVAAGIHPIVRSLAASKHYGSTDAYPLIPGLDAVARTADGALVYTGFLQAPYGTLAERMAVPTRMRIPLPTGADPARIAGGLNPGLSSWLVLRERRDALPAQQLGTVLILGATGAAGLLAVQNAFALGADRVIAAGRNPSALERAAGYGATTVALQDDKDATATALTEAIGTEAPSLVLDYVWGAPAEAAFAALGRRGMTEDDADIAYIQIGAMAGTEAAIPAALLRSRRITISGSGAGSASVQSILAAIPEYMQLIADGRLDTTVQEFALSKIEDAWAAAQFCAARVVVIPD
ncbi:zinc-binding alcohol dehydrogenase family protein [Nocardia sp. NPDC052112]|uniref:zinc-binding alcohol dehydrogenase family protein n=1 Tax=Nocardia sp. NPDC052112 TaxID=3155646 RepID=UPI0034170692